MKSMTKLATVATVISTLMTAGIVSVHAQEAEKSGKDSKGVVVAKVNGDVIYASDVKKLEKALPKQLVEAAQNKGKLFKGLRNQLVDIKLVTDAAKKSEIEKDPKVQAAIQQQAEQIIVQAYLAKEMGEHLSEKGVKVAYDEYVKEFPKGKDEFKVRHIFLKDEASAKKAIKKLEDGEDFIKVARDMSLDKSTANEGGDLGYISENDMVPPVFLKAIKDLKAGEFSKTPVKTEAGWHVIKVDDRRKSKPRSFEDMKEELASKVAEKTMMALVKGLREKSKIELFDEKGKPDSEGLDESKESENTDKDNASKEKEEDKSKK